VKDEQKKILIYAKALARSYGMKPDDRGYSTHVNATRRMVSRDIRLGIKKKKKRKGMQYCERQHLLMGSKYARNTWICMDCRKTAKSTQQPACPICGAGMKSCGFTGRPPRATASKAKWNKFFGMLINNEFHPKGCR
jgi:hypothetical protein